LRRSGGFLFGFVFFQESGSLSGTNKSKGRKKEGKKKKKGKKKRTDQIREKEKEQNKKSILGHGSLKSLTQELANNTLLVSRSNTK
jgi:hypothetical protein